MENMSNREIERIANNLFLSLSVGINFSAQNDDFKKLNINILNENGYPEFRPTLFAIVDLCKPADTPKKRELLAKAYSWLGAKYREDAIKALRNFIKLDLNIDKREPYPLFVNGENVTIMERDAQICMLTLWELSDSYEREYLFSLALDVLNLAWKLFPYTDITIAKKCKIYKKMNNLDAAISLIEKELKEPWTQPYFRSNHFGEIHYDDSNQRCLLVNLKEYQKLKERGYIYKPRPRKK